MLIDRLAATGLHWTARTLVSLLNTQTPTRSHRRTTGTTREQLENASPQGEASPDEPEDTLNIRPPDADLLQTLEREGEGR